MIKVDQGLNLAAGRGEDGEKVLTITHKKKSNQLQNSRTRSWDDDELDPLLGNVVFSQSTVMPHIEEVLLPGKTRMSSKANGRSGNGSKVVPLPKSQKIKRKRGNSVGEEDDHSQAGESFLA